MNFQNIFSIGTKANIFVSLVWDHRYLHLSVNKHKPKTQNLNCQDEGLMKGFAQGQGKGLGKQGREKA